jgi:hypothetical protein
VYATVCILFAFALGQGPTGAIHWEKEQIQFQAEVGQKEVVAVFPFENTGNGRLTINSVESSCSCTAAASDKKDFAPGEKGAVTATFELGDRTGSHSKSISVNTNDPNRPLTRLILTVDLLPAPTVSPRLLYWMWGEIPSTRSVTVRAAENQPVHVMAIKGDDKLYATELKVVEKDKVYAIQITPKDTRQSGSVILEIQTDWPAGKPRSYKVHLRILPKDGDVRAIPPG